MAKRAKKSEPLSDSDRLEILHLAIRSIEERIKKKKIASSMGDLIRLLEMEAESSGRSGVREIKATWVDPDKLSAEAGQKTEAVV